MRRILGLLLFCRASHGRMNLGFSYLCRGFEVFRVRSVRTFLPFIGLLKLGELLATGYYCIDLVCNKKFLGFWRN